METQAFAPDGKNLRVTQFTFQEFASFWPDLEKMLDSVPHTWKYWTKEYIYQAVAGGVLQVWGAGPPLKAVLVLMTSINTYPAMKVLNIVWACGHMPDNVIPVLDATFVNFAKLQDCEVVEIRGRKGWHPHLKALGYVREQEVWTKKIQNMRVN